MNLSQDQAARKLGISQSRVAALEKMSTIRRLPHELLEKIAKLYRQEKIHYLYSPLMMSFDTVSYRDWAGVRTLRQWHWLSLAELACLCDVSAMFISNMETKGLPSFKVLESHPDYRFEPQNRSYVCLDNVVKVMCKQFGNIATYKLHIIPTIYTLSDYNIRIKEQEDAVQAKVESDPPKVLGYVPDIGRMKRFPNG